MRYTILSILAAAAAAQSPAPRTMRVDYVHSGGAAEERFSLEDVVLEGAWPGPADRWIDDTNLGKYSFQVLDQGTNRAIYSRGFASLFGEWQTTDEAKRLRRAFHESVRFPAPAGKVRVSLRERGPRNEFRQVWSVDIDPADPAIDRGAPPKLNVWPVIHSGEPSEKVDLLLLGDGYTAAEMDKWHRDARRMVENRGGGHPIFGSSAGPA